MPFTAEEKQILQQYFTNCEENVFVLINLPEVIKGTLFSRYSRTSKDLRRLFLDEFISQKDIASFLDTTGATNKVLDVARAEDFYERVLVGFGDDSVAELGGAHVAIEQISVLATKSIEEHRIGLSPLEKSTRYVYFDQKVDGEYLFYREPTLMNSPHRELYLKTINQLFDTYSHIVREIQPLLKEIFPGDENEKAYRFSIRAKACDTARALLPLAALTNMGVFGNGRAFEYLLTHLLNDPLIEVREIAAQLTANLRQVIPAFIKRAGNERGMQYRNYLQAREAKLTPLIKPYQKETIEPITEATVKLIDYDSQALEKVISAIIFKRTSRPYEEIWELTQSMKPAQREKILRAFTEERQNRHHKPGREFEEPYFSFEITADWGVYKDLMRHRLLTRHRQLFTNELGYIVPEEIKATGFAEIYCRAMDAAEKAYRKIKKDFPYQAQYLVTHGAYNRFYLRLNLRELVHLTELRSSPQGHPSYRKVVQAMARSVIEKFPLLGRLALGFVDYNDYHLERLAAFRKLERRAREKGVVAFQE